MKTRIDKTVKCTLLSIYCFLAILVLASWTNTYNTATPANSDSPTEAAVRMREIKAATQERMNVDHLWQLTSTQVSDTNVGEHRKLTLTYTSAAELAAFTSGKAYVYRYLNELYYKDANGTGDTYTTQITKLGKLNLDDSILSNATWLTAKSTVTGSTVNLIKAGKNEAADANVAILPDAARLDSNTAPTESSQIANKKYVDDQDTASQKVIQIKYNSLATYLDCSSVIPIDNTIPQNTEGVEVLTVSITPASATNILKIEAVVQGDTTGGTVGVVALFQDTTANALTVGGAYSAGGTVSVSVPYFMLAGTTSETTFKIRAGSLYVNGIDGAAIFGGKNATTLCVTEYKP